MFDLQAPTLPVTALYAGVLALLTIFLSYRSESFARWLRLITRYRPENSGDSILFIVMLAISEANGCPAVILHAAGILFVLARLIVAVGFVANLGQWRSENIFAVVTGWLAIVVLGVFNLVAFFST